VEQQPEPHGTLIATAQDRTVRVRIRVRLAPEVAWLALTDPAAVGMWFGQMNSPWLVGRAGRIEFGDGDFFEVTATEIVEGKHVEFEWRFLGIGPVEQIRWTVAALPVGAEITVEDRSAIRTPAEVDQMVAGWTDFFRRLERYLATGEATRYDWREDIDGSAELPPTGFEPLHPDVIYRWMPIATDGFQPRWFFVIDDEGPRRFQVDDFDLRDTQLTFSVEIPEAAGRTHCRVGVEQVGSSRKLLFSHTGWRALGLSDSRSRMLRKRFADSWVASLKLARGLAGSNGASGRSDNA
jgi:uncharacterized protein YndB with AHSA1/START domain